MKPAIVIYVSGGNVQSVSLTQEALALLTPDVAKAIRVVLMDDDNEGASEPSELGRVVDSDAGAYRAWIVEFDLDEPWLRQWRVNI